MIARFAAGSRASREAIASMVGAGPGVTVRGLIRAAMLVSARRAASRLRVAATALPSSSRLNLWL